MIFIQAKIRLPEPVSFLFFFNAFWKCKEIWKVSAERENWTGFGNFYEIGNQRLKISKNLNKSFK